MAGAARAGKAGNSDCMWQALCVLSHPLQARHMPCRCGRQCQSRDSRGCARSGVRRMQKAYSVHCAQCLRRAACALLTAGACTGASGRTLRTHPQVGSAQRKGGGKGGKKREKEGGGAGQAHALEAHARAHRAEAGAHLDEVQLQLL